MRIEIKLDNHYFFLDVEKDDTIGRFLVNLDNLIASSFNTCPCKVKYNLTFDSLCLNQSLENIKLRDLGIHDESKMTMLLPKREEETFNEFIFHEDYCVIPSLIGKTSRITCFHLSCQSLPSKEWDHNDIGGLIFLSDFQSDLIKIKPGYVFIDSITNIQLINSNEQRILGKCSKKLTGFDSRELQKHGILFEEFVLMKDEKDLKSESSNSSLSTRKDSKEECLKDGIKKLIRFITEFWKNGGSQNIYLSDFFDERICRFKECKNRICKIKF